jgi:hypothetical protein
MCNMRRAALLHAACCTLLPDAACNKSVAYRRKLYDARSCKAFRMKWEANGRSMRQYVLGTHKLVEFSTLSHHFL